MYRAGPIMLGRHMRFRWLALALVAGGCGSSAHHGADDTATIRATVERSYRSTDADDCSRLYTGSFIAGVYKDVAHCRTNFRDRAKRAARPIKVLSVSEHG